MCWWRVVGCSGEENSLFGSEDIKEPRGWGSRRFIRADVEITETEGRSNAGEPVVSQMWEGW